MSIRLKLLVGCLCLTVVTMILGVFAQDSQRRVGSLAIQIYDDALLSTNALRSAQNALVRLDARFRREKAGADEATRLTPSQSAHLVSEANAIVADLNTAGDGALSQTGREATGEIERRMARLAASAGSMTGRFLLKELMILNEEIDATVRVFSADAYGVRNDVGTVIRTTIERTWGAMGLAAVIAFLITFALGRAIVPAVRHAMHIAKSIAAGNFDNDIRPIGRSETAELLSALAMMQDSISRHFGQIQDRVTNQADIYDGQIAIQNARFEAALDNMSQGLCMFDDKGRLVIVNQRFRGMFGSAEIGQTIRDLKSDPILGAILARTRESFFTQALDGGMMIAVSRQDVATGGQVITFEDITERHNAALRMRHMANHDALTGLPNRMQLSDRLQEILSDPTAVGKVAVLCLDLDGFKFVNDTLGHPVGDDLLKLVGQRLAKTVGDGDLVARIGGDEFAVIQISDRQPAAAESLAQAMIAILSAPFDVDHQHVTIGASIGIVSDVGRRIAMDEVSAQVTSMMKCADLALYEAKGRGRNMFCFFKPEMDDKVQMRRRTEVDLVSAFANDEFELYYQPFVNAARQTLSGFEALIRWHHPTRGMVSPAEFIPIAEEVGLIEPLGLWVLETACRQAADWPLDLSVSVNLSPVQFRSPTLAEDVRRIVRESGLPPRRLQLEVTESVLLHDTDAVLAILTSFRKLGIRISMDDFGTGYSSLGYLSRFPFDKVKIDQSFVKDLSKRQNIAVVRAVIGLSKAMGIAVIAEGVETKEQRALLLAEGCEEMQGYYFSRPKPLSDLPQLIMGFAGGGTGSADLSQAGSAETPAPPARRLSKGDTAA